jgi:hypothetical protein
MLHFILKSEKFDFDSREVLQSVSYAPRQANDCLRKKLLELRRSLTVSDCILTELIELNQKATSPDVTFADFQQIIAQCPDRAFGVCQILSWYTQVLERNVGRSFAEVGVKRMDNTDANQPRTTWMAPDESAAAILNTEIARLSPSQKRVREDESESAPVANDNWVDFLLDAMSDLVEDQVPSVTGMIMPDGVIAVPPEECMRSSESPCAVEYVQAIRLMRSALTDREELLEVRDILRKLRIANSRDNRYNCVSYRLRRFRKSLLVRPVDMGLLLGENKRNAPISAEAFRDALRGTVASSLYCDLHIWYYFVINPMVGRTVDQLRLSPFTDSQGSTLLAPSADALILMIDSEIQRNISNLS